MKKIISTSLGMVALFALAVLAQPVLADMADKAAGTWKTPEGSVIRISKSGGAIVGTIVSVKDKSRRDVHNPNKKLRGRKLPGIRIFRLKKNGADSWKGSLYNTKDGKTYAGHIKVLGANKIKLSGCVMGILCKNQTWTRK